MNEQRLEELFYFRGTEELKCFLTYVQDEKKFESLSETIRGCIDFVKYLIENDIDPFNFSTARRMKELKDANLI
jgi:hypothetical protein